MKLSLLRKHYHSNNYGQTWIPKASFNSEEEIREAGFLPNKWITYRCNICNTFHISSKRDKKGRKR